MNKSFPGIIICFFMVLPACVFLSSCVGALFATEVASIGFVGYKGVVQPTTGGGVEIHFEEEHNSQNIPSDIHCIAVLPGHRVNTKLSEEISNKKLFKVITPYQIEKIEPEALSIAYSSTITKQEKLEEYKRIGEQVGADAILEYSEAGMSCNTNFWSFKRSEIETDFSIRLISVPLKREVWKQSGKIVLKFGSRYPDQEEIEEILVNSLIDKLQSAAS